MSLDILECQIPIDRTPAQEALTNAEKHTQSSNVDVSVVSDGGFYSIRLRDFAIGFAPAVPRQGLAAVR